MDENRCVINVSLQESRREIIESFLPLYVDKTSKTYWMMGNITCAAAASSSRKMINMEKFYEWIGRHGDKIIMNDRDIRVVESMFQSGMDKETVISLFPQFAREDIEEIGKRSERSRMIICYEHLKARSCILEKW